MSRIPTPETRHFKGVWATKYIDNFTIFDVAVRLEEERNRAESVLRRIISDLPQNRDWLDPQLEREARDILQANAQVVAPPPQDSDSK
jgi:hypothetical protein